MYANNASLIFKISSKQTFNQDFYFLKNERGDERIHPPIILDYEKKTCFFCPAIKQTGPYLFTINYIQDFDKPLFHQQSFPYYQAAPAELAANIHTVR